MTLTVVVGSSGSGKTTFLEDMHKHVDGKCVYLRQYHSVRPYIPVSQIPNLDVTALPFWDTYVREEKDLTIKAGGTLAGNFTPGLSGGQRKMLLFELLVQRTENSKTLLILLDEPFAGVTDEFVPFILDHLARISQKHNVVLVTNDHCRALRERADNVLTVSAVDRRVVKINNLHHVHRDMAIMALCCVGEKYRYTNTSEDFKFFCSVEFIHDSALRHIVLFSMSTFFLFVVAFWHSKEYSGALVLIAGDIIAYYSINPYVTALVDWRNCMLEEAEALVHAGKGSNRLLKLILTLTMVFVTAAVEYGVLNAVTAGEYSQPKFLLAMICDTASMTLPLIYLGLYTTWPFHKVNLWGGLPFLLMIFLSTTYSPGSGLAGVKKLRYLFPRYYLWCMVPAVQDEMEGCPTDSIILINMTLTALIGFLFCFVFVTAGKLRTGSAHMAKEARRLSSLADATFVQLRRHLYEDSSLERIRNHVAVSDGVSPAGTNQP